MELTTEQQKEKKKPKRFIESKDVPDLIDDDEDSDDEDSEQSKQAHWKSYPNTSVATTAAPQDSRNTLQ